mgnify:FL=1
MENKKERLTYLDVAKGIGILLVVIGHVYAFNRQIVDRFFVIWLYSFHMPLFFIISGMLIAYKDEKDIWKFVKKRIKGILIPYVFFSIFSIIVFAIVNDFNREVFVQNVKATICGVGIDTLWFLPALFFGEVIFFVLRNLLKNKYVICIISAIIYTLGNFMMKDYGLICLFLGRICIAVGFIMIGNYTMNLIRKRNMPLYGLIVIAILSVILSKINGLVDLNNLVFNNHILYLINSLIGTYLILEISKLIDIDEIMYWGRNTLIVMATHLNIIYILFNKILGIHSFGYVTGMIVFVLLLAVERIIIYVVNRYMPFLMGRKQKRGIKI